MDQVSVESEQTSISCSKIELDQNSLARLTLIAIVASEYATIFLPYRLLEIRYVICSINFYFWLAALAIGYRISLSTFVLGSLLAYCKYMRFEPSWTVGFDHHHVSLLIIIFFLFSFLSSRQRDVSFDRFRNSWNEKQLLVRALLSSIYLYAFLNKFETNMFTGHTFEIDILHFYLGSFGHYTWLHFVSKTAVISVMFIEAFLCIAVWLPKWTMTIFLCALGLHLLMYLVFPVNTFSVMMIWLWMLILPEDIFFKFFRETFLTFKGGSPIGKDKSKL